jgi:hypothetical protein
MPEISAHPFGSRAGTDMPNIAQKVVSNNSQSDRQSFFIDPSPRTPNAEAQLFYFNPSKND